MIPVTPPVSQNELAEIVREEGWAESVKMGILRDPDSAERRTVTIFSEGFYAGYHRAVQLLRNAQQPRRGWMQEPWGE